jgi:maltose/moltooligosaccharide transporter
VVSLVARKKNRTKINAFIITFVSGGVGLSSSISSETRFIIDPCLVLELLGPVFYRCPMLYYLALPASKMGVYMGIFNFFIVIPQIIAATILGYR